MTVNALFTAYVAALAEDAPAPLSQRFTLAAVWHDLAALLGELPPPAVAALVDGPAPYPRPVGPAKWLHTAQEPA